MRHTTIGGGIAVLAALILGTGTAAAATGWTVVNVPPAGQNGFLLGVSAPTDTDAWAVGTVNRPAGAKPGPLIDHWNGTAWQQASAPAYPAGDTVALNSVSASGASDAWAAGYTVFNHYTVTPTAVHWDGTSWSVSPSAATALPAKTVLDGVADINPGDAYATGYNSTFASGELMHWNGTSWSQVALPAPEPHGFPTTLNAIAANGPDDVWIVGSYMIQTGPTSLRYETYSLHWNGTSWSVILMPLVKGSDQLLAYEFSSLDVISPTNVWAVGGSGDNVIGVGGTPSNTLVEHWNGTAWSIVPSPSPGSNAGLTGVTGSSPANLTAAGSDIPAGASQPQTLTLNWNGTAWTTVASPNVGSASRLASVSTSPGSAITWAVGSSGTSGSLNPLALRNG